jgi:hypothetical protein
MLLYKWGIEAERTGQEGNSENKKNYAKSLYTEFNVT